YFIPNANVAGIKLPAGQNLYLQSPLNAPPNGFGPASNYNPNQYLLTSAGLGPIQTNISGTGTNSAVLNFTTPQAIAQLVAVQQGMTVSVDGKVLAGATVDSVNASAGPGLGTVTLKGGTVADTLNHTFTFAGIVNDYVAQKLTNLWYAWANYYADNNQVAQVTAQNGSIAKGKRTLTFAAKVDGLVPGMLVSGNGVPDGATISTVTTNGNVT